jgi:hypothetical protein
MSKEGNKMRRTERMLQQNTNTGNPLCGPIQWPNEEYRIKDLRERLCLDINQLDEKPASLKRLDEALIEYFKNSNQLTDDELILFVREVAIYVGKVLILYCEGRWHTISRSLASSAINIISSEHVERSNGKFVFPISFVIGSWVAMSFDDIQEGNPPSLYKLYEKTHRLYKKREKFAN